MSDAEQSAPEEEEEEQAWLATFADLMSLLMCFFVLLLSFSEMDIQKYRQIAGSLRKAFGVQREMVLREPPKASSFIQSEFTPGRPIPSPIKVIRSVRDNEARRLLTKGKRDQKLSFEALNTALREEVDKNQVEIKIINGEIVIRIQESESFRSGSASLRPTIYPILDRIIESVENTSGRLVVGGHTDNIPISTSAYPSNWVLSSARAANVVHHLATSSQFGAKQAEIRAYADTRPLVPNDTPENRAANRRVEVIVSPEYPLAELEKVVKTAQQTNENNETTE